MVEIKDNFRNVIYWCDSNEIWNEYDLNGRLIHWMNHGGYEEWWEYDENKR